MKLTSKEFKRKCQYWRNYGFTCYYFKDSTKCFVVKGALTTGSSFRYIVPVGSTFILDHDFKFVYFDVVTLDEFTTENRHFRDFVCSLNPQQLNFYLNQAQFDLPKRIFEFFVEYVSDLRLKNYDF